MQHNLFSIPKAQFQPLEGEYQKDGLWYCGKCNQPVQTNVCHVGLVRSDCLCKSQEKAQKAEKEEREKYKKSRKPPLNGSGHNVLALRLKTMIVAMQRHRTSCKSIARTLQNIRKLAQAL